MKNFKQRSVTLKLSVALTLALGISNAAFAEQTLFKNVNIFNGTENKLYQGHDVLVEDKLITKISKNDISAADATVIDGSGKTLMPGLIDGHVHIMINSNYADIIPNQDPYDLGIKSAIVAKDFLMDGFTSIRDMGGPAFATARQIKNGNIIGPRIYPSGAFISQTSGHGDFRGRFDMGFTPRGGDADVGVWEKLGFGAVADGVPEVLQATRINLRHGATQIKIMAGGGGSSKYDPIDTTQYSKEETCAIVEAAADWGTYVGAHIFTDRAINRSLDCGVKTFEHAFFASYDTYKRAGKEGAFMVPQMWGLSPELMNNPLMPKEKLPMVAALAEQYKDVGRTMLDAKVKVAFMSDWVGEISEANKSRRYEIYWRTQMFGGGKNNYDGNFEVLKQLTSVGGEMLALSGPRNPAPGPIGVVEVGATADLLLVDGNPLEDIGVINGGYTEWYSQPDPATAPIETIKIIMKEGKIYKNTL